MELWGLRGMRTGNAGGVVLCYTYMSISSVTSSICRTNMSNKSHYELATCRLSYIWKGSRSIDGRRT